MNDAPCWTPYFSTGLYQKSGKTVGPLEQSLADAPDPYDQELEDFKEAKQDNNSRRA